MLNHAALLKSHWNKEELTEIMAKEPCTDEFTWLFTAFSAIKQKGIWNLHTACTEIFKRTKYHETKQK